MFYDASAFLFTQGREKSIECEEETHSVTRDAMRKKNTALHNKRPSRARLFATSHATQIRHFNTAFRVPSDDDERKKESDRD
jgi:hypothetical protein